MNTEVINYNYLIELITGRVLLKVDSSSFDKCSRIAVVSEHKIELSTESLKVDFISIDSGATVEKISQKLAVEYDLIIVSPVIFQFIDQTRLVKLFEYLKSVLKNNGNIFIIAHSLPASVETLLFKESSDVDRANGASGASESIEDRRINLREYLEFIKKNKSIFSSFSAGSNKQLFNQMYNLIKAAFKNKNFDHKHIMNSTDESFLYVTTEKLNSIIEEAFKTCQIKYSSGFITVFSYRKSLTLDKYYENEQKEHQIDDWIIKTDNLRKKYKKANFYSVNSITLRIKAGSVYGILGPNGAGKTTTLSMLCGLMSPTEGQVEFKEITGKSGIKKLIGYVPQELALFHRLTAYENLYFFGRLYNLDRETMQKRAAYLMDIVGLSDRGHEIVHRYSTGMMRRLNLAIGLMHNPKIILLDEPTVGIDPQSRNCIFDAILKLKEEGMTILYTTHYMEEATKLCDTIAIMDHGRIIMKGNPVELVRHFGFNKIYFFAVVNAQEVLDGICSEFDEIYDVEYDKMKNLVVFIMKDAENTMLFIDSFNNYNRKNNLNFRLIKIEEPTLESLFLDLTGRTLRDYSEK